MVPVCFAFEEGRVYSPLDEKPKRVSPERLARVRNIQAHPFVALVVDHYEEDWTRLGWLLLRGTADVLERGEEHRRAVGLLRAKYPQYRTHRLEDRPILRITLASARNWGTL